MKSIIVPKNSIPPAQETVVLQLTFNEAVELIAVCNFCHDQAGHRYQASVALIKHLATYCDFIISKPKEAK